MNEEELNSNIGKSVKCKSYSGDREIRRVLFAAKDYFGMDEPELCFMDQYGCIIEASNILEVVG